MEWCGTLYWEYGITEKLARAVRTLIVLLVLGIVAVTGYDAGSGNLKMKEEFPESISGKRAVVDSTAAASITAETTVNAAGYFADISPVLSVSEATESALLLEDREYSVMSPEMLVWSEESHTLTVPAVPEAAPSAEDQLVVTLPSVLDRPETVVPSVPDQPEASVPSVPEEPEAVIPSVPDQPEAIVPSVPDQPEAVIPSVPKEPETAVPSVPEEPDVVIPSIPTEPETIAPPVTDSSDNPEDSALMAPEGFLVDESGIIYGVTDALVITDGCLILPSEGCTGIASGAFADAPGGIYEVYIPSNITYIADGAFTGLFELEWFEAAPSGTYYTEDGVLLSDGGACILSFPAGRIGSYKVPAGVSRFAYGAFDSANIEAVDATDCILTDVGNLPETILLLQR